MSRRFFKYSFCVIGFFLLGFIFGQYCWRRVIHHDCSTFETGSIRVTSLFYNHFHYRTIQTCQNDRSKLFLTIAILSSFERLLIYLPSILNTWALESTNEIEVVIFLEEKSSNTEEFIENFFVDLNQNPRIQACLFIVKLKHVENSYPPQKKSFYAMKFLYTFYRQRTFWLLRLDDNAYVNIEKLLQWLRSIDHQRALYIGQSGSGRRNGSAIHFPDGQYFCMGGSGIILSQRTLIELGPWLDYCLTNEILTKHEDVELGRCILNHVHISCTNAYNSKTLFYHHYGPWYSFGHDLTTTIISQALILHPIKDENTFKQIFAFYLREKQYLPADARLKPSKSTINYVTFLSRIEFDLVRDIHYQLVDARWRSYITEAVRSYVEHMRMIWSKRSFNWTLTHGYFLFGYHRFVPSYGLESMIEIRLHAQSNSMLPMKFTSVRERFHIRHVFSNQYRFDYREINLIEINESIYQLNLIVVSYNKDEALRRFVNNFQREILNDSIRYQYFTLTILYFIENNQISNELIDSINRLSTSRIRLSVINQKDILYNRGLGRELASKLFTPDQILFFLDADLEFTGQALDNTRRIMIHQLSSSSSTCTVYFPIVFSSFSNRFTHEKNNGLFSIYGFGNVAVRKRDLDEIGGWQTNNYEWGNEDVDLFQRFSNPATNCYIFRTVEPGLKHHYHPKMCNGITNLERKKTCHNADINLIGSQADMVNYLFENQIIKD